MIDEKLRILLQDIGRALSAAMADSAEINASLAQLRKEGYVLFLGRVKPEGADAIAELVEQPAGHLRRQNRPVRSGPEPEFRINGRDLQFLQSIGIDPTRKIRRRRNR